MQVKEIKPISINQTEIKEFKPTAINKKNEMDTSSIQKTDLSINPWQKDILLQAIDMLENNKHLDDIHPLDRAVNAPIETFEEALLELNYFKTSKFRNEASSAQANLNPHDVLYLFQEDTAA